MQSNCRDIPPEPKAIAGRSTRRGAATPKRPLRELCQALTVVELVKAGLPNWGSREQAAVKLLGPASRGIRVSTTFDGEDYPLDDGFATVSVVRMERPPDGFARGTLKIGAPCFGHAWVDQVRAAIPPFSHWLLVCQGCGKRARKLLWPPGGKAWRCRRCVKPRYPNKNRLATLPPRPDALDPLDALERDIRRMRLIERGIRRMMMTRPPKPIDATA